MRVTLIKTNRHEPPVYVVEFPIQSRLNVMQPQGKPIVACAHGAYRSVLYEVAGGKEIALDRCKLRVRLRG